MNSTSLNYLEIVGNISDHGIPVLTNIMRSHRSLEVLKIRRIMSLRPPNYSLFQLVKAAGNSRLKKLRLGKCEYDKLPLHMRKHPLEPFDDSF